MTILRKTAISIYTHVCTTILLCTYVRVAVIMREYENGGGLDLVYPGTFPPGLVDVHAFKGLKGVTNQNWRKAWPV